MRIGGQYVGLGLGDSSEEIRTIKAFMRRKFSYASILADTPLFDVVMVETVAGMQGRYENAGKIGPGDYTSGIINLETKYVMGYLPRPPGPDTRPLLITVCGTGVPWWVGPDADVARAVEDLYKWQPAAYPATPFPMNRSVQDGRRSVWEQMERMEPGFEHRERIEKYGCVLIGYSQGAIVTGEIWLDDILHPGGRLHWAKDHIIKAVTFGNPMREAGRVWPDRGGELPNPGAHGIADRLLTDTPSWWRDYAHRGDLYSDCEGESGENKTAIYKVVMGSRIFSGPDSLLSQVMEVLGLRKDAGSLVEGTAIFKAIMDAGLFFVRGTGPHVNYSTSEAIDYLRS